MHFCRSHTWEFFLISWKWHRSLWIHWQEACGFILWKSTDVIFKILTNLETDSDFFFPLHNLSLDSTLTLKMPKEYISSYLDRFSVAQLRRKPAGLGICTQWRERTHGSYDLSGILCLPPLFDALHLCDLGLSLWVEATESALSHKDFHIPDSPFLLASPTG